MYLVSKLLIFVCLLDQPFCDATDIQSDRKFLLLVLLSFVKLPPVFHSLHRSLDLLTDGLGYLRHRGFGIDVSFPVLRIGPDVLQVGVVESLKERVAFQLVTRNTVLTDLCN